MNCEQDEYDEENSRQPVDAGTVGLFHKDPVVTGYSARFVFLRISATFNATATGREIHSLLTSYK